MISIVYHVKQALGAMRRNARLQIAAIGALALALTLVGLAALAATNIQNLTGQWGRGEQLTIFMKPGVRAERVAAIRRLMALRPEVARVSVVTPKQAHRVLERALSSNKALGELGASYLPYSLEVRLRAGHARADLAALMALLSASPGVAQVDARARWVERVEALGAVAREVALAVAVIVALAALFIIGTTIRLGVYARREEIEIQKLVGATASFVRAPFLVEGALQGVLATALALGLVYLAHYFAAPTLKDALSALLSGISLSFFTTPQLAAALAAGSLLGLAGSGLALGKHLEV